MINSFTFGCGQGATKAMIRCVDNGVLDRSSCRAVNSTTKDIPATYREDAIVISNDPDSGCGKIREVAKKMMISFIKNNPNYLDQLIGDHIDCVNIITTTEGASGSGASVILADYIRHKLNKKVIIILITGFETDIRGIQNTINYFKDISDDDYTVRTVSNKKYIDTYVNTFKAESIANDEVSNIIAAINYNNIVSDEYNIDDTDHLKIICNSGLMFTGEINIGDKKYKNKDQLEKDVSDMIDYSSSLDFVPSATKIGVYMDISEDNMDSISLDVFKNKLCSSEFVPELFIHKQNTGGKQFIRVIATGMDLPIEELETMYKKYVDSINSTKNKKNNFFESINNMSTDAIKDSSNESKLKDDFFSKYDSDEDSSDEIDQVLTRTNRKFCAGPSSNKEKKVNKPDDIISNNY